MVASGADRPGNGARGWLARRGLSAAARVTARTPAEADRYKALGVSRVVVIPPGVGPAAPPADPAALRAELGVPPAARLVVAAGRFDAAAGLRTAVWAFDVLKYVGQDVFLLLVGDGPERGREERFARAVGFDDYRVRFAGSRADVPAVLALAAVVWLTHDRGGVQTALEAMAAGVPVVGVDTPDLGSVVADGVSGRLAPAGDRVRLAAVTQELLDRPADARRLGDAGRDRAGREFPAGRMVERYAAVYDDLSAGSSPAGTYDLLRRAGALRMLRKKVLTVILAGGRKAPGSNRSPATGRSRPCRSAACTGSSTSPSVQLHQQRAAAGAGRHAVQVAQPGPAHPPRLELPQSRNSARALRCCRRSNASTRTGTRAPPTPCTRTSIRLEKDDPEQILILGGDHIYKMDYGHMVDFHREQKADLTHRLHPDPGRRVSRHFGIMESDAGRPGDRRSRRSRRRRPTCPDDPGHALGSMGIYVFNTRDAI